MRLDCCMHSANIKLSFLTVLCVLFVVSATRGDGNRVKSMRMCERCTDHHETTGHHQNPIVSALLFRPINKRDVIELVWGVFCASLHVNQLYKSVDCH